MRKPYRADYTEKLPVSTGMILLPCSTQDRGFNPIMVNRGCVPRNHRSHPILENQHRDQRDRNLHINRQMMIDRPPASLRLHPENTIPILRHDPRQMQAPVAQDDRRIRRVGVFLQCPCGVE